MDFGHHDAEAQKLRDEAKAKRRSDIKEKIKTAIEAVPLTPAAWARRKLDPPDFLMGELFSTTSRLFFAADTGLGKSMIALALAMALRLGRDFLHWHSHRPARVLVVDGEMPRDLLQERIALACAWFDATSIEDGLFVLSREDVEDMPPLDTQDGQDWLLTVIECLGGVDFAIMDNVSCLAQGDLREESTWSPLIPLVRELSQRRIGQLWLHHVGHDKSRPYGSRRFAWSMDSVLLGSAVKSDECDVSMSIEHQKARRRTPSNRSDFDTVTVTLQDGTWTGTRDMSPAVPLGRTKPVPLNGSGRNALTALAAAIAACGEKPPPHDVTRGVEVAVKLGTWRRYFAQIAGYEPDEKGKEAEKKAFTRGRENALAAGRCFIWGEWAWPL